MKKLISFLLILLAIVMFNCQSSKKSDANAIRKQSNQWDDYIRAKDIDKISNLLSSDAIGLYAEEPIRIGAEGFRKSNEGFFAKNIDFSSWNTKIDTIIVSDNLGYNIGNYHYSMNINGKPVENNGKWVTIYKKINGQWKVAVDAGTDDKSIQELLAPISTVEEFTAIENEWNTATFKKDAKTLDLLYAKEYTYIDPTGKVYDKQQDISEVTSGNYKSENPSVLSDIKVNSYGNVTVVKGLNTAKATLNGKDISGTYRFVDVFILRDGRWQCVSTQSSKLPKK
jgi:ketosteroid isomerase-like protein